MDPSDAVASLIRERAARLERFHDRIVAMHVVVDVPHKHGRKGNHFVVQITVTTPQGEIAVTRDPPLDDTHQDFHAAVRDAFDAAVRQLEDDHRHAVRRA